ncbi:MAG: hypothetical protein IJ618_04220 [Prevotella sp.]|nr:hypothetical protein [Prevotella sp.]
MKKNKLTVLAFAALAAITFSACAGDTDVVNISEPTPENPARTSPTFVFKLSVPSNTSLHYNKTRAVGDNIADIDEEATIKSLYMYEFNAATDELVNKVDITSIILTNPEGTTGGITAGTASLTAKDYVYEYKPGVKLTYNDARQFLFVANYPDLATSVNTIADYEADNTKAITTLTAVKSMVTDALTATIDQKSVWKNIESTDVLPMTAFAMLNNSDVIPVSELNVDGDNVVTTTVDLTRIVARIDVVNNTPDLVIEEVKLIKANDRSYLLAETETTTRSDLPAGNTKVTMAFEKTKVIAPATSATPYLDSYETTPGTPDYLSTFEIPIDNNHIQAPDPVTQVVVAKNVKLEQAFYIYEDIERPQVDTGQTDDESNPIYKVADDVLRIQVRGTLKGIPVSYNIPFSKDLVENAAPGTAKDGIAIKRNNLYTVMLGDGKAAPIQTGVKFKIQVLDWKQQEVTDYFDASIFKIYDETIDNSLNNSTTVGDSENEAEMVISTKTINVVQGTAGTPIEFVIASPYSEVNTVVAALQSVNNDAELHDDWITIEPLDADGSGDPTSANKGYKVTIQPNTDGTPDVRNASIKVQYKVNTTQQTNITYTIVQAKS